MKMRCKDFDKLIHLFLDQKLDEQMKKEMEEHLSQCPRCKEKFEALKLVQEKARGIEIPEPEDAYWESFSRRVRERIISKKQPFGAKLKEFASNIFVFTPAKLKIAAAVASIVLVFIVGKLYIDYRGTIPERIKPAEKEISTPEELETEVKAPGIEKEKPVPVPEKLAPVREEKKITERKALDIEKEKIKEKREKLPPEEGKDYEVVAKKKAPRDVGKKAPIPEIMEQEVAKTVEKAEPVKGTMRTLTDAEEKKAKPPSKVLCEAIIFEGQTKMTTTRYSLPDGTQIPDVDYRQKELSADSLRVIIDFWSKFIKDNPEDTFVESAYLQIAASYYYLFDKTKEEGIRVEGIKRIEEFLKISQKEETKEGLSQRLEKLKGLKEK
jgi:hypothetical protein